MHGKRTTGLLDGPEQPASKAPGLPAGVLGRSLLFFSPFTLHLTPGSPFSQPISSGLPGSPTHVERAVFVRGCGGRVRMESGCNKLNGVEKETERPRRDICGHPGPAPFLYPEPSRHIPGALRCGKAITSLSKLLYEEKRKQGEALNCSTFFFFCLLILWGTRSLFQSFMSSSGFRSCHFTQGCAKFRIEELSSWVWI